MAEIAGTVGKTMFSAEFLAKRTVYFSRILPLMFVILKQSLIQ